MVVSARAGLAGCDDDLVHRPDMEMDTWLGRRLVLFFLFLLGLGRLGCLNCRGFEWRTDFRIRRPRAGGLALPPARVVDQPYRAQNHRDGDHTLDYLRRRVYRMG